MKKIKRVVSLLLIFCVVISLSVQLRQRLIEALQTFGNTSGKAELTLVMQNALYKHLKKTDTQYLTIHYDSAKRISAITIHGQQVNLLASEMTVILLEKLKSFESASFGIPIGNLTGLTLLSGKGPKLPLKPVIQGNIANEIKSTFQSAGINQTLHKVMIHFVINIKYLAPIDSIEQTIEIDIVVAETLIVGNVPIIKD